MKRALFASAASVLATILAPAQEASAQLASGPYIGAAVGISWLLEGNQSVAPMPNSGLSTPSDHFRMGWEPGFIGSISAGWAFGFGPRIEIEGQYRRNDADTGRGLVFSRPSGGGSTESQAIMLNLLWDIRLTWLGDAERYVVPYLGGGIGYGWRQFDNVGGSVGANRLILNDDGSGPVYQFIAGLGFPLDWAGIPGLTAGLEYRYIMPEGPNLNALVTGPGGTSRLASVDVASHNHNLLFSVRYTFGSRPAPAPVAAAAPAPARTFMVFFDWNRADLTDRARQIIAEAAQARSRQQVTRIDVTGHTDTSGSAQYNQGLSVRRANAVAAELVRLGVPRNEITARGVGESQLLVATPDNTREPQNRRVEIVLR